jgi:hypothetical protein
MTGGSACVASRRGPGQHTLEILAELGHGEPAIQEYLAAGIAGGPELARGHHD